MNRVFERAMLIITAFVLIITLSGCAEEEEPPDIDKDDLIGRWTHLVDMSPETYAFFGDMKFTKTTGSGDSLVKTEGKYEVEGNKLKLKYNGSKSTIEYTVRFRKSTTLELDDGSVKLDYRKE